MAKNSYFFLHDNFEGIIKDKALFCFKNDPIIKKILHITVNNCVFFLGFKTLIIGLKA